MQGRKQVELSLTKRVAKIRGGKAYPEHGQWPDCWIEDSDERIPVEVVTGFPRPPGEKAKDGAVAAKAEKDAALEAARLSNAGAGAVMYGVVDADRPFAIPINSDDPLPLPMRPAAPVAWVLTAIDQKIAKLYSEASGTILIVDFHNGMPLYEFELAELAAHLATRPHRFREVWVCPEVSAGVAQRVPQAAPAA